jgi:hypothetical protein
MDARMPSGLPINLATALQLSRVRPLDIAATTAQVEQALALYLQARVLWVPTLNAGVDYFRHDGVQQNIFTGPNFQSDQSQFAITSSTTSASRRGSSGSPQESPDRLHVPPGNSRATLPSAMR